MAKHLWGLKKESEHKNNLEFYLCTCGCPSSRPAPAPGCRVHAGCGGRASGLPGCANDHTDRRQQTWNPKMKPRTCLKMFGTITLSEFNRLKSEPVDRLRLKKSPSKVCILTWQENYKFERETNWFSMHCNILFIVTSSHPGVPERGRRQWRWCSDQTRPTGCSSDSQLWTCPAGPIESVTHREQRQDRMFHCIHHLQ